MMYLRKLYAYWLSMKGKGREIALCTGKELC